MRSFAKTLAVVLPILLVVAWATDSGLQGNDQGFAPVEQTRSAVWLQFNPDSTDTDSQLPDEWGYIVVEYASDIPLSMLQFGVAGYDIDSDPGAHMTYDANFNVDVDNATTGPDTSWITITTEGGFFLAATGATVTENNGPYTAVVKLRFDFPGIDWGEDHETTVQFTSGGALDPFVMGNPGQFPSTGLGPNSIMAVPEPNCGGVNYNDFDQDGVVDACDDIPYGEVTITGEIDYTNDEFTINVVDYSEYPTDVNIIGYQFEIHSNNVTLDPGYYTDLDNLTVTPDGTWPDSITHVVGYSQYPGTDYIAFPGIHEDPIDNTMPAELIVFPFSYTLTPPGEWIEIRDLNISINNPTRPNPVIHYDPHPEDPETEYYTFIFDNAPGFDVEDVTYDEGLTTFDVDMDDIVLENLEGDPVIWSTPTLIDGDHDYLDHVSISRVGDVVTFDIDDDDWYGFFTVEWEVTDDTENALSAADETIYTFTPNRNDEYIPLNWTASATPIQDAVDVIENDGIIYITDTATYAEDVVIPALTTGITITGPMMPDRDGSYPTLQGVSYSPIDPFGPADPCIHILGEGTTLQYLNLYSSPYLADNYTTNVLVEAEDATIQYCDFYVNSAPNTAEISQAIVTRNGVSVDGLVIDSNNFAVLDDMGDWGYEGIYVNPGMVIRAGSGISITNNTFSGEVIRAITTEQGNALISDNTIGTTLPWMGDGFATAGAWQGINVRNVLNQTQTDVTISDNTVDGYKTGIRLGQSDVQVLNIIYVYGNDIINNEIGVRVLSAGGVDVWSNNIYDNDTGFANEDTGAQPSADTNWWGSADGPSHEKNTFNVASQGDVVTGDVEFVPWLDGLYPGGNQFAPIENIDSGAEYSNFQDAVDEASAGNLVEATGGTYTEDFTIDKELTVDGGDAATTTIMGIHTEPTSAIPQATGNILVTGADATVSNFTFQVPNIDDTYTTNILVWAPGLTIENNIFAGNSAAQDVEMSQAIVTQKDIDVGGLTIQDNWFTHANDDGDWGYEGIYVNPSPNTDPIYISNNTFEGKCWRAIFVETSLTTVSGNTIGTDLGFAPNDASTEGAWQGIAVRNFYGENQTDVTVEYNDVTGFNQGIRVGQGGQTFTNVQVINNFIDSSKNSFTVNIADGVTFTENSVENAADYGVKNNDTGNAVDASANWWGYNDGSTVGIMMSDDVDYTPWFDVGTDTSEDPGFQPDYSTLHVDDDSDQTGATSRIQEGIDLVTDGGTVNVLGGTYDGQLTIDKGLTLQGEQTPARAVSIFQPTGILGAGEYDVQVYASDVTITQFTLDFDGTDGLRAGSDFSTGVVVGEDGDPAVVIENFTFTYNLVYPAAEGVGLILGKDRDVSGALVQNNMFNADADGNDFGVGIYVNPVVEDGGGANTDPIVIDNNYFDGHLDYGIASEGTNVQITNNTIQNTVGTAVRHGIRLNDWYPAEPLATTHTITGNTISDMQIGIAIAQNNEDNTFTGMITGNFLYDNDTGVYVGPGGISMTIAYNDIYSNDTWGLQNESGSDMNAEYNWWGSADGPANDCNTYSVTATASYGNTVDDMVDFVPFLDDVAATGDDVWPVTNTTIEYASIQCAIDDAGGGATLDISDGYFTEDLLVDQNSLDIVGQGETSFVVGSHTVIASSVSFQDLTFNVPSNGIGLLLDASGASIDGVMVTDCIFNAPVSPAVFIYLGGGAPGANTVTDIDVWYTTFNGPTDKIANAFKIGGAFGSPVGCAVDGFTFSYNTVNYCSSPINIADQNIANVAIEYNTFTNTDGAVYIWGQDGAAPGGILSDFSFSYNTVDGTNTYGLGIDNDGTGFPGPALDNDNFGANIVVEENDFGAIVGDYGYMSVSNLSAGDWDLNAQYNWWGDLDPSDNVSGRVDYDCWYTTADMTNTQPMLLANEGMTVVRGSSTDITNVMLDVGDCLGAAGDVTFTVTVAPINGSLSLGSSFTQEDIDNLDLSYSHDGSDTIEDEFTFTVADTDDGSIGATVFEITIHPVRNQTQGTTHLTIQDAIDNAVADDQIDVGMGTYTENLTIDKALLLNGSNPSNNPEVRVEIPTETRIEGTHTVTTGDLTITGFTLDPGAGTAITIDTGASEYENIDISDNIFDLDQSPSVGIYLGGGNPANGLTNITMEWNIFNGPEDKICNPFKIGGFYGNPLSHAVTNLYFEYNEVNYCSTPINLQDGDLTNINITNNTYRNTDGGVYIWSEGSPTGVINGFNFTGNDFDSSNTYGIGFDDSTPVTDDDNYGPNPVLINENLFDNIPGGYGYQAVTNLYAGTVDFDASSNWWGDRHPADDATGMVDYEPWYTSAELVNYHVVVNNEEGITVDEDELITITNAELEFIDYDHVGSYDDGQSIIYPLYSVPEHGILALDGTPLVAEDTFTQDDIDGGLLTYEHDGSETTSDGFTFTVSDGIDVGGDNEGYYGHTEFSITVNPVNDAPTFTSSANLLGVENQVYTYNITSTDVDDDLTEIVFSLDAAPLWLSGGLTDNGDGTATLTATPAEGDAGDYNVEIGITDGETPGTAQSFTITVYSGIFNDFDLVWTFDPVERVDWTELFGDPDAGFEMTINPADNFVDSDYYFLNISGWDVVANETVANGDNAFYYDVTPAGFMDYWDAKGVNATADPGSWQEHMYQIILGNEPFFYLGATDGDLNLWDGLEYDFNGAMTEPLKINGDFPIGDYEFIGTIIGGTGNNYDMTVPVAFDHDVWIWVGDIDMEASTVEVYMNNPVDIYGFQFDGTDLPNILRFNDSYGGRAALIGSNGFEIYMGSQNDLIVGVDGDGLAIPPGNDLLTILTWEPDAEASTPLDYPNNELCLGGIAEDSKYTTTDQVEFDLRQGDCSNELVYTRGDMNINGGINVTDVIIIVDIILGDPAEPTDYQEWAGDLNIDGFITVTDAVIDVDLALGNVTRLSTLDPVTGASVSYGNGHVEMTNDGVAAAVLFELSGNYTISGYNLPEGWEAHSKNDRILMISMNGAELNSSSLFEYTGDMKVETVTVAGWSGSEYIAELVEVPNAFSMGNAYPNPFNPTTTINFSVPEDGSMKLVVHDVSGRIVAELVSGTVEAGYHQVTWDATQQASGVYFVTMTAGDYIKTNKVLLVK